MQRIGLVANRHRSDPVTTRAEITEGVDTLVGIGLGCLPLSGTRKAPTQTPHNRKRHLHEWRLSERRAWYVLSVRIGKPGKPPSTKVKQSQQRAPIGGYMPMRAERGSLPISFSVLPPRVADLPPARRRFYLDLRMAARKTIKVATAERTEICRECRFAHHKRGDGLYCHGFPPVFVYDPSTGTSSPANPETNPDAWCGEFRGHLSS